MRKWIIWIVIILLLAATGFCVWWFFFRDTSDGGKFSNREVLFAVQSVLEDQGVNLDDIVEDHQKVVYSGIQTNGMYVSAEGEQEGEVKKLSDKFESYLVSESRLVSMDSNEFKTLFEKPLVYAYSVLHESVFGKQKIRQNTWVEQTFEENIYRVKVWSDEAETIYIWLYDVKEDVMFEILINFNYRRETNIYSLESRIVDVNVKNEETKEYVYTYGYFNRNIEKVLNFDYVTFKSSEKITEKQETYKLSDINLKEISKVDGSTNRFFLNTSNVNYQSVAKYVLEDLDVNFKEYDLAAGHKATQVESIANAYAYYNK